MDMKKVEGLIGRSTHLENLAKDSDKDGTINALDCKPNNPNKQGFVHDAIKKWKKKREERRETEKVIRTEAETAYYKEKMTQSIRAAREKARLEGERKIRRYKEGGETGFFGAIGHQVSKITKPKAVAPTPKVRKGKKGKKQRRIERRAKQRVERKPQPPSDFLNIGGKFI